MIRLSGLFSGVVRRFACWLVVRGVRSDLAELLVLAPSTPRSTEAARQSIRRVLADGGVSDELLELLLTPSDKPLGGASRQWLRNRLSDAVRPGMASLLFEVPAQVRNDALRDWACWFVETGTPPPPPAPPPAPPPPPPSLKMRSYACWVAVDGDRTLRVDYSLNRESVVLDVGGYEGDWAAEIFSRYVCRVHVFEPVPQYADRIARRFAANPAVTVCPVALGAFSGRATVAVDGDASSLHRDAKRDVEIEVIDVVEWLDRSGLSHVDLMKINIEGAEFELLDRLLESTWIKRIRDVQVQFHDFVPDAHSRMEALLERLARTHRPTYRYPFIWENWTLKDQHS